MKKLVLAMIAGTTALTMSTAASATTLFDSTNFTALGTQTFTFAGEDNQTALSFAGYNLPSGTFLYSIMVQLNGSGANLLTGIYTLTPAASGSRANQFGNSLNFSGSSNGSYDTYTTRFSSTAGSQYTLSYGISSYGTPNGLRITTSAVTAAVPEPATWALMILGMGAVGFAMRRRKNVSMTVRFA